MLVESSTHAKNQFGAVMDAAMREPVIIQRSGRNAVVMLAYQDYEEMLQMVDRAWGKRAAAAKRKGFIGAKKSAALIEKLLNA
ncbi:MAG: type II toxin-antitoxin system prevent-host-death family antitoxin [Alphaproteobacteria bacterium]|nr:type II toxin-antitoxin system prevent-host-death family antitoxin [Alphaproteobacteria bacterium]